MQYYDSDTVATFIFSDGPGAEFAIEMVEDTIQSSLQIMCDTGEYVDIELTDLMKVCEIVARRTGHGEVSTAIFTALTSLEEEL